MVPDRHLDPYYAEFVPMKGVADVRPHVHPGYEFLFMLEGDLEIKHGDKLYVAESGDAVYFDASTPHSYRCSGKDRAVALIVTMHQAPIAQPALNLRPLGAPLGARSAQGSGPVSQHAGGRQTVLNSAGPQSEAAIPRKA